MKKVMLNCKDDAEEHATTFDTIKAAYAAASTAALQSQPKPPFVITAQLPQLKRDRYQVEIKPVGYLATCSSERVSANLCGTR